MILQFSSMAGTGEKSLVQVVALRHCRSHGHHFSASWQPNSLLHTDFALQIPI